MTIKKIISGGQTGADQAGLDAALKSDIPHGGAIPRGRLTENGRLDEKYTLQEMSSTSYPERTEKNVVDSDGTVIFSHGELSVGSLLTLEKAREHKRPVLHLDMANVTIEGAVELLKAFVEEHGVEILNVAGAKASKDPEIYDATFAVVERTLAR